MIHVSRHQTIGRSLAVAITFTSLGFAQDLIPPSVPTGLTATAATCGQVNLSWNASVDNTAGSGMKAYIINRSDGVNTTIGSARTTFPDINYVHSSTTVTYNVVAMDNAGNKSAASNLAPVTTPSCSMSAGETVVDSASTEPLGKSMATYGARTVFIYQKPNPSNSTKDTWLYVSDSNTGQSSRFLLHSSPGYYQKEMDYVLTSATELWTLSCDASLNGKLLVSQYQLNGSLPTSATLLSTKSLGDNYSYAMSMIRLKSGGLVVSWSDQGTTYTGDLVAGYAYRSPTGTWIVHTPVILASSGGVSQAWQTRMVLAQHPTDSSIWMFVKEDTFHNISALHFTETTSDLVYDWVNLNYISQDADGDNGPEGEFPFLAVAADPTRNAILLAYQSRPYQFVYIDSLYGSMNSIFLKEAYATVAQIGASGSKTFIPFQTYMERVMQFGMSVLSDGTIWLAYQPINSQTLTWNGVYASKYQNGAWSAPALAGSNYNNYNNASGLNSNPGALIYRTDQPQVAFLTPDQQVHSFTLSNLASVPPDTTSPATSISNPLGGAAVSGSITVSASASDNIGVTKVELLVDGSVVGAATSSPYSISWNTTTVANGGHTLQTRAYDAAGNIGLSATVTVTVSNPTVSNLAVAILNPTNGGMVPRNQNVTISASATDSIAVTKVEFYVNNSLLGTATAAPYNYPWNVPAKKASYTIQAKGYDAAGNTAVKAITVSAQ